MRIRNNRSPFPDPLLRPPQLRPNRASYYAPKLDDPFLVEETSRRMGWSCYPLKRTESEIPKDDSSSRLQLEIQKEIKRIFEDDESDEISAVEETSDYTWAGQGGAQDNGGGGLDMTTNNKEDPHVDAVNFAKVLRSVFSQQGIEDPHTEKENISEWKTGAKAVKEEPQELQTEVDGRKIQNQEDAKEGNSNQKKKDASCVVKQENELPPEDDVFELIDLLDLDSDETTSELSDEPTRHCRRKRKKIDDEDWAVERKAPKRKPKKAKDEATKCKSRCPEKKPKKKRGRPKAVEKRKVGRPRKASNIPSTTDKRGKKEVVERPRRSRQDSK